MVGSILIAEDDDNDLLLIQRALRAARIGNEIQIARDGAEALALLLRDSDPLHHPPAVAFLDMHLPLVDGLEILERVRRDARTHAMPVVMLTSSDEVRDVARSYRLGVNSYVRKPVNFDDFQETVVRLGQYWSAINHAPWLSTHNG